MDLSTTFNETGVSGVRLTVYDVTGTVVGLHQSDCRDWPLYHARISSPVAHTGWSSPICRQGMHPAECLPARNNDTSVQFINICGASQRRRFWCQCALRLLPEAIPPWRPRPWWLHTK